jgi:hypothetical protein
MQSRCPAELISAKKKTDVEPKAYLWLEVIQNRVLRIVLSKEYVPRFSESDMGRCNHGEHPNP